MFFEQFSDGIGNTHCYADWTNPEPKKDQPGFFIPGQMGWNDGATHAFFHCRKFLTKEVINAYCGQYN